MPKKNKTQYNGFYWYMQSLRPELQRQRRTMGMQELVAYARPRWKSLTDDERERFDRMAKEQKRKEQKSAKADEHRLDNQGNVIAFRQDSDVEISKLRTRDRKIARSRWPASEDILDYPFYFISFQYLCEHKHDEWLPCEVGLVEWTMEQGITNTYHKFIDPNGIPLGFRFTCQNHSDETHKIPIDNFELADNNHLGLYTQIQNFINPGGKKAEYPPIYCLHGGDGKEWKMVNSCINWVHGEACVGQFNHLSKIYCLEDMVVDLYDLAGHPVSETSAITLLTTTAWDYEPSTRCPYHEEIEVKHCALGTCKRYAFALSDALKSIYGFELTEKHLPTQDDSAPGYTIIPPSAVCMDSKPIRSRPQPSSRSNHNGPFASRDVRYLQNEGYDDDLDDASSQDTFNGTTASAWGAPPKPAAAPWSKTSSQAAPSVASNEDFPSLAPPSVASAEDFPSLVGGDTGAKPKYAGRAMAPHPSELPKPVTWQGPWSGHPEPVMPRPTMRPVVPQAVTQKRTIHEAVAQQQAVSVAQPPQQPCRAVRPPISAGRGIRPSAPARTVNSTGFNPMQGETAHGASLGRPTLAQAVQHNQMEQSNRPAEIAPSTMNSLPRQQSGQQVGQQPGSYCSAGRGIGPVLQQPGSYPNPALSGPTQAQGVNNAVTGPPQPLAGLGRGRGRGIYSGAPKQAGGGTGMAAPPGGMRPPPGFGRGVAQQLASMSLENQS